MPRYRPQQANRRQKLRDAGFLPFEVRQFSKLAFSRDRALHLMIAERKAMHKRFDATFRRQVERGKWRNGEYRQRYVEHITGYYRASRYTVKFGPFIGATLRLPEGHVNPWSYYRDCVDRVGGESQKGHISPWVSKRRPQRKRLFNRLALAEGRAKRGTISKQTVESWITDLMRKAAKSKGKTQSEYLRRAERLSATI